MNLFVDYLEEVFERLDFIKSLSIIGSSYREARILPDDEIDLYIVLDSCSPQKINMVLALLQNTKMIFGKTPYIETRRGPFRNREALQLHAIIDDLSSIHHTSAITLADWANNSRLIKGIPIANYINKNFLNSSFRYEIGQTLEMLTYGKIKYKKWIVTRKDCRILEEIQNIGNLNEYCELLKYSYKAMKNDFVALSNLSHNLAPDENRLEKFIGSYKSGRIANVDLQQTRKIAIGWNSELCRIFG